MGMRIVFMCPHRCIERDFVNCTDTEVIRIAVSWLDKGHRVTLGTVVQTWGSAPRPPGSLMIIRDDGQVSGSVSGGCIEDDLIGRVKRGGACPEPPGKHDLWTHRRRRSASACPVAVRCRSYWSRSRSNLACASFGGKSNATTAYSGAWT
ncbi:XdhC family protein [Acidiferrobacter sp.]|uniref:XdhC family protein n=1 Tax=Acidiferrobacter sp. TaxID=1872107 RepID=UPI00344EFB30